MMRSITSSVSALAGGMTLLAAAAGAAPQAELVRTGGVLGGPLTHTLSAPAPTFAVLLYSLQDGPTPLALIDPGDPRSLSVGIDLYPFGLWAITLATPGGTPEVLPLPADASLQGLQMRAQFVTVGTGPGFFGDLSNRTRTVLALPGFKHFATNERAQALDGHSGTLLEDGRVLLAGGTDLGAGGAIVGTLEFYDPQVQGFELLAGSLAVPRSAHTATRLLDGRVLIAGGSNAAGQVTSAAEIFDPATGTSTQVGSMLRPRVLHSATLLPDGRVLVAGGLSFVNPADQFATLGSTENTSELFDPALGTWSFGPNLPKRLSGHGAVLGSDGRVLIAGGIEVDFVFGLPFPTVTAAARRFDPAGGNFVAAAALPSPRVFHTMLADDQGRVLSIGGANLVGLGYQILGLVQRYDPAGNAWTDLPPLVRPRAYPNAVPTAAGFCVLGGINDIDTSTGEGTPEPAIEVADGALSGWSLAGDLLKTRLNAITVPVDGGLRVLTTGVGQGAGPADKSGELFVP